MLNKQFFRYLHLLNEKYTKKPDYNLFRVLRSESDEVRLHSKFISDLLDPLGDHNFKEKFIKQFLKQFSDYIDFDFNENIMVDREYQNIDILIRNGKTAIVIENKIYATDQEKQLSNYYKKMVDEGYQDIKLIYLTLTGYSPEEQSIEELPHKVKDNDLILASYESDIYSWISKCIEISARNAPLREACIQYLDIINKLTNKVEDQDHMDDLKELLLIDNNLSSLPVLFDAYNEVITDLQLDLWNKIALGIEEEFGEIHSDSVTKHDNPREQVKKYVENKRNSKYLSISSEITGYDNIYLHVEQENHIYFGVYCDKGNKSQEYIDIENKTKYFKNAYRWGSMPIGLYAEPQINFKNLTPEDLKYLSKEKNRQIFADNIVNMLKDIATTLSK
ncbi:hypothetical protein C9I92_06610 [Photobacterium ganghwense]|uniref:PD-(D/E)XK nuclease superfamily protein n=1 Tax=Photobacterium ganghwense TaxID=320778 RepID=A0A0J1HE54_9GAMM|nr:PD-(D/E)XK nuclease family protein [Photobacterium ganghwense]KLV09919.1 hypothetical protein ABT57_09605 [Photobacterium ganghwense]PSU09234.1 hypothetical protein C9I92_06610 [Photobacterium ganghwense]QSV16424.1 PD-(D/E)XK nuclease family protein [Photobacterium ganghwense]